MAITCKFFLHELGAVIENEEIQLRAFGARLKEIRGQKKITQEQLSDLSGLDLSHIARMETAKRNPRLTTLIVLARALQMPLAELMDFEVPDTKR